MEKVYNYLKENGTFYYATIDGDRPSVRPFGFIMKYEGHIYVGMGDHKNCFKQSVENPKICIVSLGKGTWLRLFATAVHDTSKEVNEHALKESPFIAKKYSEETGLTHAVLRLENCYAEFMGNDGAEEVIEF